MSEEPLQEPAASEEKALHEKKRGPGYKPPTIAEKVSPYTQTQNSESQSINPTP